MTLWDNQSASWTDLGGQFYLSEADVKAKRNRAAASFEQLKGGFAQFETADKTTGGGYKLQLITPRQGVAITPSTRKILCGNHFYNTKFEN